MNTPFPCSVVLVLMFSIACGSSWPTLPSGTSQSPTSPSETRQPPSLPSPTPAPLIDFPPLAGPSRTFLYDRDLSYRVSDGTKNSRIVLYDNGALMLQYPPSTYGDGRFRGAYQVVNGVMKLLFNSSTGRSVDEPWDDATATLEGDSLTVEYHEIMQHSDFENAVYVLMR